MGREEHVILAVMHSSSSRPTYCIVDLGAIAHNIARLCAIVGPHTQVAAVVKADGYGHGAVAVGRAALGAGASWLAVAFVAEGLELRAAGITAPILVLGWTPTADAPAGIAAGMALTVYDLDLARAYAAIARSQGRVVRVHFKVDTGMGRLGVLPGEALACIRALHGIDGLAVEGVFTHFATADEADRTLANTQLQRFQELLAALQANGLRPALVHAANSAATLSLPESRFDLVRVGIAMYGLHPSDVVPCPPDFRAALAWKSAVAQVKRLPPGHPVSYGAEYHTRDEELIATIPIGYADGFRRITGANLALVHGQRVPIVGRVCMDQVMANVTAVPGVALGDEVVLIGRQGAETITAEEVARHWQTINYEVTSGIMERVPRYYHTP